MGLLYRATEVINHWLSFLAHLNYYCLKNSKNNLLKFSSLPKIFCIMLKLIHSSHFCLIFRLLRYWTQSLMMISLISTGLRLLETSSSTLMGLFTSTLSTSTQTIGSMYRTFLSVCISENCIFG